MKQFNFLSLFLCGLLVLVLSSCKTYHESMSTANNEPCATKLPAMAVTWRNSYSEVNFIPFVLKKTMINEITANCIEEFTDSVAGTIEIELTYGTHRYSNLGLAVLSGLTGCSLNLLGMPIGTEEVKAEVRVNVYDSEKHLLRSYNKYYQKDKSHQCLYYGRSGNYMLYNFGKSFANQFKKDIENDTELLEAIKSSPMVYYPMGNDAGKHILTAMDYCDLGQFKKAHKELDKARESRDYNEYHDKAFKEVSRVANEGLKHQVQERTQIWTTIGTVVASAAVSATTAAIVSSKGSSNSKALSGAPSGSTATSSQSSGGNSDSSSSDMTRKTKDCNLCNGTGKMPEWSVSEGTGSKSYCSECKKETNPKHRHVKCTVCKGTGQVFDKWE